MRRHQRFIGKTAAEWTALNPILGKYEPGYESDTDSLKVGDGETRWNALQYMGGTNFSTDVINALNGANSPSATNVFATMDDLASTNITELVPVISQTNTPPGSPADGDRYLVSTAPTGAWVGQANNVAEWSTSGGAYTFTAPVTNNTVYITASLTTKRYNGTSWVAYTGTALLQNGNTLGAPISIGSRDNQVVYFKTNNANRVRVNNAGMNITGNLYLGSLTATATAKLHVAGTLRFVTGNQGANKVLVSDASGNADWQTLTSGWALDGNTVGAVKSIGTIDAYDFPIITTNVEVARFYANGKFSIGAGAVISDSSSVSIGAGATTGTNREVAIGNGATALSQGVSIGFATSTNDRGVAIGYGATNTGAAVSIGESATAVGGVSIKGTGLNSSHTAIMGAITGGGFGIVIQGTAEADDNIAIGFRTKATANGAMVFGRSVDNSTFLTNSTANSVGFGWSEATPTILFAKTADQYINGTGNLGLGLTSPTAKFHVRGTTVSTGAFLFKLETSTPATEFEVDDYGNMSLGASISALNSTLGIIQSSNKDYAMLIYERTGNYPMFGVYSNGGTGVNDRSVTVGFKPAAFGTLNAYPFATADYGCVRLNGTGSAPYQLFSNITGANFGHLLFAGGGSNRSFLIDQDASEYFRLHMISVGSGTAHMLSSDGAVNYLSAIATQQLGVGNGAPHASAKLEVTSTTMGFRLTPMLASEASAITPVAGLMVNVSDTDATFTSVGYWEYAGGAWAKM